MSKVGFALVAAWNIFSASGIVLLTFVGISQVDHDRGIVGSQLLQLLQLVEGLVVLLAAQVDGGDQEVGAGIVVVQPLQLVGIFHGGVEVVAIAIDLSQRLQRHGIVGLNAVGFLQLALGAGHVAGLAQDESENVVRLRILRSVLHDAAQAWWWRQAGCP